MLEKEVSKLKKQDPALGKIIEKIGLLDFEKEYNWTGTNDYFESLARNIAYQQLAGKAAASIWNKVKEKTLITPEKILKTDLQGTGLSSKKIEYIKDLARKFLDKTITPEIFDEMTDQEVIEELIQVKGIGKWTAEMFLMFSLKRLTVFSNGDLGLRRGVMLLYNLPKMPGEKELNSITEKWNPYKTIAALYLWKWQD